MTSSSFSYRNPHICLRTEEPTIAQLCVCNEHHQPITETFGPTNENENSGGDCPILASTIRSAIYGLLIGALSGIVVGWKGATSNMVMTSCLFFITSLNLYLKAFKLRIHSILTLHTFILFYFLEERKASSRKSTTTTTIVTAQIDPNGPSTSTGIANCH